MITHRKAAVVAVTMVLFLGLASAQQPQVDLVAVARIREEGLQRSRVMDTVSYMADVLGARLTLSEDMKRAQVWLKAEMDRVGLVNTAIEPFMDYGMT